RRGSAELVKDEVVSEGQISLRINGRDYMVISMTPLEIEEFAVGHLMAEGIIERLDEISDLRINNGKIDVQLRAEKPLRAAWFVSSGCGSGGRKIPPIAWMKPKRRGFTIKFTSEAIIEAAGSLNLSAETYRRTGGTHSAALHDERGRALIISEDIGRHTAVDKVIGKAALKGLDLSRALLASSGRLSSDIVLKAVNAGVPVVVSLSAPTDMGVKLAEAAGLTLIGFARGRRFNVYAHPERIILPEGSGGSGLSI
ncbi:MAG: formate dehydrogenase accessory protein, partial [Candidatus Bathyarchaeota archaeon B63]